MTACGVRLMQAPDAPVRSAVYTRISPGQSEDWRWWVDLGDLHPSGDIHSLHAPGRCPGYLIAEAGAWARTSMDATDRMTISLDDQAGSDSGARAAVCGKRSLTGNPASWKDPL